MMRTSPGKQNMEKSDKNSLVTGTKSRMPSVSEQLKTSEYAQSTQEER